jgi:hypothetical protein
MSRSNGLLGKKRGHYKIRDPLERFWSTVDKDGSGDCWLWNGVVSSTGYGVFSLHEERVYAHRYAYEASVGPIPEGKELDHLCRVRRCVNPSHLEPVSRLVNILRGESRQAICRRTGRCSKGHLLEGANAYTIPTRPNSIICRTCKIEANRRYNARKRLRRDQANAL